MPATHQRDFLQKLRALLIFIEFDFHLEKEGKILIKDQYLQYSYSLSQPPEEEKKSNPWVMPCTFKHTKKKQPPGRYHTHRNPRTPEFRRMLATIFDLNKERIHHCIKKLFTSFRKPIQVELKLENYLQIRPQAC